MKDRKESNRVRTVLFYRDYIKSPAWERRKEEYYSRHAKACFVCGDTNRVELNHKRYGNYGYERDTDLVPLCRMHHQIITDRFKTQKNMRYQHDYMIDELKREWDAEHESPPVLAVALSNPMHSKTSRQRFIVVIVDKLARPIWWMIGIVLRRK